MNAGVKMSKKRIALIVLLSGVFLYSLFSLISIWMAYQENERFSDAMREEYLSQAAPEGEPGESSLPAGQGGEPEQEPGPDWYMEVNINFTGLKDMNREIIGWIMIPDSKINYPLVQARDNQKYLTKAPDGSYSKLGSIFADYRNGVGLSDRNTIIYGHNTKNGSMFGGLHLFLEEEYVHSHPYFYIFTEEGTFVYEIFSAYITDAYSDTYSLDLDKDQAYSSYLEMISAAAAVDIPVKAGLDDKIVTLSTCTSSSIKTERVVVHGKLLAN